MAIRSANERTFAERTATNNLKETVVLPNLFASTTIPALGEVIRFSEARHDLLAGNIANMDTPGYKARDLSVESFQERLRLAMSSPDTSLGQEGPPGPAAASAADVLYHDESQMTLERQVAELSKNLHMHNMSIALLSSQYRLLQTAISERV